MPTQKFRSTLLKKTNGTGDRKEQTTNSATITT